MAWSIGIQFLEGEDFSLLCSIATGSGAHLASYTMSTGDDSPEVVWQERKADHSPPFNAKVKNGDLYINYFICLHSMVLN
jgi:hypothetical protein